MKSIDDVLKETMDEFEKNFKDVTINYSALMKKVQEAGGGVDLLTVPKFIQRAVMMAYMAGQESNNEKI